MVRMLRYRWSVSPALSLAVCVVAVASPAAGPGIGSHWSLAADAPKTVERGGPGAEPNGRALTLADALSMALMRNPELASYALETRAREAEAVQAAARPNPELQGAVENVGGSGDREKTNAAETTLLLSQLIELGGKRAKRERAADLRSELSGFDYEAKRLAVLTDTTKAFVATLAAQERLRLSDELEHLADDAASVAERRLRVGAAAPAEALRARVVHGRLALDRTRAAKGLHTAREALSASWGAREPAFDRVVGSLAYIEAPPPRDALRERLDRNPELARWVKERAARSADLAIERARRIPDITLGAGGRYFSDNGDAAMVFELDVPLPLFDRNRGGIMAAERRLEKAEADEESVRIAADVALSAAYTELQAAYNEATTIRDHVIPDAEASLRAAKDAMSRGLFHSLDVLDAQRTLFDVRVEYVRVLEAFHFAAADIERLTGEPLSPPAEKAAP